MKVFDAYAASYDLLYRDKAYGQEAGFVLGLLAEHGIERGSLLELGYGTGVTPSTFRARASKYTASMPDRR